MEPVCKACDDYGALLDEAMEVIPCPYCETIPVEYIALEGEPPF